MNTFLILPLEILLIISSPQSAVIQQKEVELVKATPNGVSELPPCFAGIPSDFATRCPRTTREYFRSRGWMPSEGAIKELEAVNAEITALCVAATMSCDWGIDWYSTAPDLARLKGWMSLLDADSRRLERFSRRMESAERIIAMFDLARIVAVIPRVDMQREASRLGWQAIQRAEQFLPLSSDPAMASRIGDAAKAFRDAQDAASARCAETEKIRWITRPQERIRLGADGASLYLDAKSESCAIVSKQNEYPLSRLKGEELLIEIRTGESFYLAAQNAWKTQDATAQLSLLSTRAENGDFGAWVAAARPDFLGIRSELARARVPLINLLDTAKVLASRSVVVPAPPIESKKN